ncbi:hypothetical protein ACN47E_007668 [Coniothyrium glycines]
MMVQTSPTEKIVVFSQYLKYLDIVDLVMRRKFQIECLRYDGTVPQTKRIEVQKDFANLRVAKPLLITAGAGSVGLNLTTGKIVVLVEEWWNHSVQAQAISRCHRQGAQGEVLVMKFHVGNSAIDAEISRVCESKVTTNEAFMAGIIHKHDEIPKTAELLY